MEKSVFQLNQSDRQAIIDQLLPVLEDMIRHETRTLKAMVNDCLDSMEFFKKATNFRLGAIVGHETKRQQAIPTSGEVPVFESADINEALRVAMEIQKGKKPSLPEKVTVSKRP